MALPLLVITPDAATETDPVAEFAADHIGDAETVTIKVVYTGYETAPDILTVDRSGAVVAARSAGPVDA
jgi:hypothetical protein